MTAAMNVLGGKWKLLLLNRIYLDSPARFGALRRRIPAISQSMLTAQLREMEQDGLVARQIYAEMPPRVEYTLTELGHSLKPVIQSLCAWGEAHAVLAGEAA